MSTLPASCNSDPSSPSRSISTLLLGPVATLNAEASSSLLWLAVSAKSSTLFGLSVSFVWFTSSDSELTLTVKPGIPVRLALPTRALTAVYSTEFASSLTITIASSMSFSAKPTPAMPMLAVLMLPPTARYSTAVSCVLVLPSATVKSPVAFLKAKLPLNVTRPNKSRSALLANCSNDPASPSKSMTSLLPGPVATRSATAPSSSPLLAVSAKSSTLFGLSVSSVWFTCSDSEFTVIVRPGMPVKLALPTRALTAVYSTEFASSLTTTIASSMSLSAKPTPAMPMLAVLA